MFDQARVIFVFVYPGTDITQVLLEQLHIQNLIPGSRQHETFGSIFLVLF